ncbi:MAG TPA: DUF3592 domain-containing protein [Candidatus Angelobacter sp.]
MPDRDKLRILLFPFALIVVVLMAIVYLVLHLWRWSRQRSRMARAEAWPVTDAKVESSYELDESSTKLRTLLGYLKFGHEEDAHQHDPEAWTVGICYYYRVSGGIYAGTYFLPKSYRQSRRASEAGKVWVGKKIRVRYHPDKPEQSMFLESDGAPGRSRIPVSATSSPYVTGLPLK